ncbi:hypothetical protein T06_8009 [Trichinella sp. T6]|nr:hypothetical protein T06_8009 [Trichinella sp. T6]
MQHVFASYRETTTTTTPRAWTKITEAVQRCWKINSKSANMHAQKKKQQTPTFSLKTKRHDTTRTDKQKNKSRINKQQLPNLPAIIHID